MAILRASTLAIFAFCSALPLQAEAQDPGEGERLFRARCASCHSLDAGQNRLGPNLQYIMGRTAGTLEGARYSPSLQASGIVWDEESLDAYLANPRQAVPGTTMTVGVPNAAQRGAIIAYLSSLATTQ